MLNKSDLIDPKGVEQVTRTEDAARSLFGLERVGAITPRDPSGILDVEFVTDSPLIQR